MGALNSHKFVLYIQAAYVGTCFLQKWNMQKILREACFMIKTDTKAWEVILFCLCEIGRDFVDFIDMNLNKTIFHTLLKKATAEKYQILYE